MSQPKNNNQADPPQRRAANHVRLVRPPNHPPPPRQTCPRCGSNDTKFCYYNNYSLSQPRYLCRGCHRYWTQGGTLRNIPIGGGSRKGKRAKVASPPPAADHHFDQLAMKPLARAIPSLGSASLGPTAGLVISGGVGHHQNLMRAANPLPSGHNLANNNNLFNSPAGGGGFFSGGLNLSGGAGAQFRAGSHMALLQGMRFQSNLRAQQQQVAPTQAAQNNQFMVGPQVQQRPLGSLAQGFVNNAGVARGSSVGSGFWSGGNNGGGDHGVNNQGAFNQNQWNNKNNGNNQQ